MPIYIETIINQWFNDEKNLSILNGIVRHLSDRQIANETGLRIDRVENYRKQLKDKGLLATGFYNVDHEKLGLVQVMDFLKERPLTDDIFLTFLVRISRPFGYLQAKLLPPHMIENGYHLAPGVDVINKFSTPFVVKDFRTHFEKIFGKIKLNLFERSDENDPKVDLLSIYICKEVQKGIYRSRALSKSISQQITARELGIQPNISNVNRRLRQLKKSGVIFEANPLNFIPLRPYYSWDSALVKKNSNFNETLAALAELNVVIRVSKVLNDLKKAYISLQYHFSQKWEILGILNEYLEGITFFDHSPFGSRWTVPYEYFKNVLSERKGEKEK